MVGMTRRDLAALASVSTVAAQAPPSTPAAPEDLGQQAKAQIRSASAALEKFKVDIAVEPAFQFKA